MPTYTHPEKKLCSNSYKKRGQTSNAPNASEA
jgi:hypothetical protein